MRIGVVDSVSVHFTAGHYERTQTNRTSPNQILQERTAKISDDETRRSFVENVKSHRDIVRAWQAAGIKS